MRVHFYNVGKRKNSTWVPPDSSAVVTRTGALRSPSSISSPTLSVQYNDASGNPTNLNYCYIEEFNRYYFVKDWTFEEGLWICSLECDVLASFKSEIIEEEFYILRSSATFDGSVIDNFYPAKSGYTKKAQEISILPEGASTGWITGFIILTVVGQEGALEYYQFQVTDFTTFCQKAFGDIDWADIKESGIKDSIVKIVMNPFQYVSNCMWLPFGIPGGTEVSELPLGYWKIPAVCTKLNTLLAYKLQRSVTLSSHPQASRGDYLNHGAYHRLEIASRLFGVMQIDTNKINISSPINVDFRIDPRTGVYDISFTNNNALLGYISGMYGVPVQINEARNNPLEGVISSVASLGSIASVQLMKGVGYIGNAINEFLPTASSKGSNGSTIGTDGWISFFQYFLTVTDEDNSENGRPYMKRGTFKSLGTGYYLVEHGDMNITGAYSDEISRVKSLLEGGVYYA